MGVENWRVGENQQRSEDGELVTKRNGRKIGTTEGGRQFAPTQNGCGRDDGLGGEDGLWVGRGFQFFRER